jgi:hypothetical protein
MAGPTLGYASCSPEIAAIKGVSMNGNSEENKDHVELTEKSAQQWLKIRRYTPVRDGDVSEQGLKEVGRDGTASTGADKAP